MKLLPFDNKSELAVVVDLPEGSSLEDTERALFALAGIARALPEVRSIQILCGHPRALQFQWARAPLLCPGVRRARRAAAQSCATRRALARQPRRWHSICVSA